LQPPSPSPAKANSPINPESKDDARKEKEKPAKVEQSKPIEEPTVSIVV
jgi:hypothetical protein